MKKIQFTRAKVWDELWSERQARLVVFSPITANRLANPCLVFLGAVPDKIEIRTSVAVDVLDVDGVRRNSGADLVLPLIVRIPEEKNFDRNPKEKNVKVGGSVLLFLQAPDSRRKREIPLHLFEEIIQGLLGFLRGLTGLLGESEEYGTLEIQRG